MIEPMIWIAVGQWSIIATYFAGRLFVDFQEEWALRRRERELSRTINEALDSMREEMGENPLSPKPSQRT